jgi:hypothetical protein
MWRTQDTRSDNSYTLGWESDGHLSSKINGNQSIREGIWGPGVASGSREGW